MRHRMRRVGLIGLLSLLLTVGWGSAASADPTWSFELIPAGPLVNVLPGAVIDFDMKITSLGVEFVRFNPADFGESGFSWNFDADKPNAVDEDSFTDAIAPSYFIDSGISETFDFGTLKVLDTAPGGTTITFIAKAVPDPIDSPNVLHDPFELESTVIINIFREPGPPGMPLPGTALLLGVGLAGALAWRRALRG